VPTASDGIAPNTVQGFQRSLQIGVRDASQRLRSEQGADGVAGGRDNHELAVREARGDRGTDT
jgi:hypothetical protein